MASRWQSFSPDSQRSLPSISTLFRSVFKMRIFRFRRDSLESYSKGFTRSMERITGMMDGRFLSLLGIEVRRREDARREVGCYEADWRRKRIRRERAVEGRERNRRDEEPYSSKPSLPGFLPQWHTRRFHQVLSFPFPCPSISTSHPGLTFNRDDEMKTFQRHRDSISRFSRRLVRKMVSKDG